MNNGNGLDGISRETYKVLNSEQKELIIFDLLVNIHRRTKCLERGKTFNTACATGGGIIGGFLAIVGKYLFFEK